MNNPWLLHLKQYKRDHPSTPYGTCMKEAKKTYTKKAKNQRGGSFISDIGDDIKNAKLGSKALDYLGDKVKQHGYGRKRKC